MNECSVCSKPVPQSATECSLSCSLEASQRGQKEITQARSSFTQSMQKMMSNTDKPEDVTETPMFYIKHRWMKNRNLVCNSLILSFNSNGIASIKDVNRNRYDADTAVKFSKGLMELAENLEDFDPKEEKPIVETAVREEKSIDTAAAVSVVVEEPPKEEKSAAPESVVVQEDKPKKKKLPPKKTKKVDPSD